MSFLLQKYLNLETYFLADLKNKQLDKRKYFTVDIAVFSKYFRVRVGVGVTTAKIL
jgi:hypothetical protein